MTTPALQMKYLDLDPAAAADQIVASLRTSVRQVLKKRGLLVAISGGIDSSVVAALCVRAFSPSRVFGLLLPEADSSPDSTRLGAMLAEKLGIQYCVEDIGGVLRALRCYERRDEAIRSVIPEYGPDWKCKIVLPKVIDSNQYSIFSVVVKSPEGEVRTARLTADAYLAIVAATNFKQRTRKMMEYYYADRLNYAVAGTPNRLEYDQGFFVKNGDGAADVKPIAHLYKSQVYQMADYLEVPEEIRKRPPTTDTYSLEQSQDEFYFALPYPQMDLCLYGKNNGVPAADIAVAAGLSAAQVERMYQIIEAKRNATQYLHQSPLLVEPVF